LEGAIVMPFMRTILLAGFLVLILADAVLAEDKSFYSPVIDIDPGSHRILISTLGSVF